MTSPRSPSVHATWVFMTWRHDHHAKCMDALEALKGLRLSATAGDPAEPPRA
ncbi:hypothetical protein [Actinomadura spongiicola]|uniref:hypothetical protein n=1 Tax=Actinomadura spongiicola TaxID=2303421 RepID=UPI0013140B1D|nr:hypothetical protein [Actinomadura spongiicola]